MFWLSPPSPHPNVLHAFVDQDEPGHNLSAFNGHDSFISLETSTHIQASQHITLSSSSNLLHSTTQHSIKLAANKTYHPSPKQSRVLHLTISKQALTQLRSTTNSKTPPVSFSLSQSILVPQPRPHHLLVSICALSITRPLICSSELELSFSNGHRPFPTAHFLPLVSNRPKSITTPSHPHHSSIHHLLCPPVSPPVARGLLASARGILSTPRGDPPPQPLSAGPCSLPRRSLSPSPSRT